MRVPLRCASEAQVSRHVLSSLAALIISTAPSSSAIAAAADKCPYAALEALPAVLTRVSNAGIRNSLPEARSMLLAEPLLADPALLSATAAACKVEESNNLGQVTRTLADLCEELEYQVAKGISDPRIRDPDDAGDLQRSTLKARSAMQRYIDSVEQRSR